MTRTAVMLSLLVQVVVSLPVLNITTAESWPAHSSSFYYGDIRAALTLPEATGTGNATTDVQLWWRRNDLSPTKKGVIVTNANGAHMKVTVTGIDNACGTMTISHSKSDGTQFYVYYLAHYQSGGGAHLHFNWWNCTSQTDESCVLSSKEDLCSDVLPGAQFVDGLQNRPQPSASKDRTPTGEPFHGFTQMELVAAPQELAQIQKLNPHLATFMEHRHNSVRMLYFVPAKWALESAGSSIRTLTDTARPGEYFTYQIGLYPQRDISVSEVRFGDLKSTTGGGVISSSAQNCFNTEGTDMFGQQFVKTLEVKKANVGSLWIGVDISVNTTSGTYKGQVTVVLADGTEVEHTLTLVIAGSPVTDHGDDDIYNMSRLRWLNSNLGINTNIPAPYTPITTTEGTGNARLTLKLINKEVLISETGLPSSTTVLYNKNVQGVPKTFTYQPFNGLTKFVATDSTGAVSPFQPKSFTTNINDNEVGWTSVMSGTVGTMVVTGTMTFDSHLTFNVTFDLNTTVSDISLSIPTNSPKYTVGMGNIGSYFKPFNWVWDSTKGDNRLWVGETQAGFILILKGEGSEWNNPLFSKDYPIFPFIPSSWGGVDQISGKYGANITESAVTTHSGGRGAGAVSFLFDLILTPAKPLNMTAHWGQRYFQVGYGTQYMSPETVKAKGTTVVTLHQGIPGVVNDTLVNPYINYPFVPDTVTFMENYTRISHDLDMRVKFYYTIRELSNHATELYALKALDGEIVTNLSPYDIPQQGYCHDWDCHGGGVYLHEHLSSNYTACWQNALSNGEWDTAVCDIGASRWFNYYIEGLQWSIAKDPHMDGVYFDGINFDFVSMRRLRRVMDSAAVGKKFTPVIDIHTGNVGAIAPPGPRYAPYFAHADLAWNGEGFKFQLDEAYWLVEVSAFIYGIPADRLGGGDGYIFKSLIYGMTQRNTPSASTIWNTWDQFGIEKSEMFSYFDPAEVQPVGLTVPNSDVKISTYLRYKESALVCIASWATAEQEIQLTFNNSLLGGSHIKADAPLISGIQKAADLGDGTGKIKIAPGSGIVITLTLSQ